MGGGRFVDILFILSLIFFSFLFDFLQEKMVSLQKNSDSSDESSIYNVEIFSQVVWPIFGYLWDLERWMKSFSSFSTSSQHLKSKQQEMEDQLQQYMHREMDGQLQQYMHREVEIQSKKCWNKCNQWCLILNATTNLELIFFSISFDLFWHNATFE